MTWGNPSHEEVIAALGFVSERSLGLQVLPLSVRDGHHGVSVASALGYADIDAYVTEVVTRADAVGAIKLTDLPLKSHE